MPPRDATNWFAPKGYQASKAWPLIVFVSAGDQPAGWNNWKPVCEKEGVFFCSPFAAGNPVPAGQRTRIILDMLDDVRRNFRIDPEQTYLSGFSGGARMACAIGFALPEYFGGIAPVCGTNPIIGPHLSATPHPGPPIRGFHHRREGLQSQGK